MSSRGLTKRMRTLFPQDDPKECRVCNEPVVDGRWSYCSERCRDIAQAVQRMFIWENVREKVLERDDYECVECGSTSDLQVDHIERIADGGHKFDESNLQTLCGECHTEKTAEENSGKQREVPDVTLEDYMDV